MSCLVGSRSIAQKLQNYEVHLTTKEHSDFVQPGTGNADMFDDIQADLVENYLADFWEKFQKEPEFYDYRSKHMAVYVTNPTKNPSVSTNKWICTLEFMPT